MNAIVTKEHKKAAQALRKVLAKFAEVELLCRSANTRKDRIRKPTTRWPGSTP